MSFSFFSLFSYMICVLAILVWMTGVIRCIYVIITQVYYVRYYHPINAPVVTVFPQKSYFCFPVLIWCILTLWFAKIAFLPLEFQENWSNYQPYAHNCGWNSKTPCNDIVISNFEIYSDVWVIVYIIAISSILCEYLTFFVCDPFMLFCPFFWIDAAYYFIIWLVAISSSQMQLGDYTITILEIIVYTLLTVSQSFITMWFAFNEKNEFSIWFIGVPLGPKKVNKRLIKTYKILCNHFGNDIAGIIYEYVSKETIKIKIKYNNGKKYKLLI